MSSKKDKLIEEAQRLVLRGQLDKAIKAYEQVVALDPSAIIQRQRLAELFVKAGRTESARSEFEALGKHYASNGFYLKAIAVYKKLQVMFSDDISITLTLAGLNEKHGLVANALSEYKQAYDYYEKTHNTEDAFKILEKMHKVDQSNAGIMLKLAEGYFQAGLKDESYVTFSRLASLLLERGDSEGFNRLDTRIQQLFPEKAGFMLEVLAEQIKMGSESAVSCLQALLRSNPNNRDVWELIIEAYRRLNQPQRVKVAYQHYLKFFPDELLAQKGLVECLVAEKDVLGALALLGQYEKNFVDGRAFSELLAIYKALEQVDPVNVRILQGAKKNYEALGDEKNAAAMDSKISSLLSLSGKPAGRKPKNNVAEPEPEQPEAFEWESEVPAAELVVAETAKGGQHVEVAAPAEPPAFDFSDLDETESEIEIEIELDDDEGTFATVAADETHAGHAEDAWLDSADTSFDSAAASPRSVKFGSDVDLSDAQSHYDLGVAFKEMGLYDEAISEFRIAAEDPERMVTCLILQGACLREKGDLAAAQGILSSLLKQELSLEDLCSAKYDLALIHDAAGRSDEAAALLAEIDAVNPGFRDVRSRLEAAGSETDLDFSDEELRGFDLK